MLEPGRRYRFTACSDGVRAVAGRTWVTRRPGTPELTGVFRTAPAAARQAAAHHRAGQRPALG
ncbi:hypothetical protein ACFOW8_20215 [Nocardia rhizosphaerae]|uniref:DUF2188 domain-containing protein n=1 Tax=Nocardia rhizosphaerae TaxID=1691571 RepID=A0ABV8LAC0_9NOCA